MFNIQPSTFKILDDRHFLKVIIVATWLLIGGCSQPGYRWEVVFNEMPGASFRGIAAVDETTCWVSGTGGTILRTVDEGKSWQNRSIPGADSLDFRDIEAFGPDTAIAMSIGPGASSRLYSTTDGGQNWEKVYQNKYEQGFYDAIAFWENGYGVLQGDPIDGRLFIMVSRDSGRTWQETPRQQMPQVEEGEYAFAASGTQLVASKNGQAWIGTGGVNARVLQSSDYGDSWSSTSVPIIQGEPSTGIFSLSVADDTFAIAVGGDYTKEEEGHDNVIYSDNGGTSWNLLTGAELDYRSAVCYAEGMFITVGPSGSEYSVDYGQHWQSIKGPGFHTLSIGKGGADAVWAAGRHGAIAKLVKE